MVNSNNASLPLFMELATWLIQVVLPRVLELTNVVVDSIDMFFPLFMEFANLLVPTIDALPITFV